MSNDYYNQLLVALALIFGATVGIADALAEVAVDATFPAKLAEASSDAPSALPSVTAEPLSVAPESAPASAPSSEQPSTAPSAVASEAPSSAASAPVSGPDVVPAALDAIKATQTAVEARNLPAWLLAFSAILWTVVAVLRRVGRLGSRKAVAVFTLLAAVIGGLASQLVLGVNLTQAVVIALGGPGSIALNEVLRAFGFFASSNPGSGDLPRDNA
jgi:hypothetical protein